MSAFDEIDARAASAIGRQLSERVVWRPMLAGGRYSGEPQADPARPVRGDGDDPFQGVVTWRMPRVAVGGNLTIESAGGGVIGVGSLCIEFEAALFAGPEAMPRKPDRFELPEDDKADLVEVVRVVNDGGAWITAYCAVVSGLDAP